MGDVKPLVHSPSLPLMTKRFADLSRRNSNETSWRVRNAVGVVYTQSPLVGLREPVRVLMGESPASWNRQESSMTIVHCIFIRWTESFFDSALIINNQRVS